MNIRLFYNITSICGVEVENDLLEFCVDFSEERDSQLDSRCPVTYYAFLPEE